MKGIRRWRRPKATRGCSRCTTRRAATSASAPSPPSAPTAPAPPMCRSSRDKVKTIIDGVGLMGHDDHTDEETADLTTLPSQTKRMAVLLYRIQQAGGVR